VRTESMAAYYLKTEMVATLNLDVLARRQNFLLCGIIEIDVGIAIEIEKLTGFGHGKPGHSITIPMSRNDLLLIIILNKSRE
jgi:hypothetical protein